MNLKMLAAGYRLPNLVGIAALILISWIYLFSFSAQLTGEMEMVPGQGEMGFTALAAMWAVMMVAMMLPSAVPMIMIFSSVNMKRKAQSGSFVPVWVFISGYLFVWFGFSLIAAFIQFSLQSLMLLSSTMAVISPLLGGLILVAAGIYQFSPSKNTCLKNCKSPLDFISSNWMEGKRGALLVGFKHGAYCLGCCWAVMSLLFVVGIMNVLWIALIGIFILAEKFFLNKWAGRLVGALLILWGIILVGQLNSVM